MAHDAPWTAQRSAEPRVPQCVGRCDERRGRAVQLAQQRADGGGALDGSNADLISQIPFTTIKPSPDSIWSSFVSKIGAATRTELQRASLADLTATSASNRQSANSTVDLDEENINLLSFQ